MYINKRRALEIAASPDMKDVTHNRNQVYIHRVDEQSHTARFFPVNEPKNDFDLQPKSLSRSRLTKKILNLLKEIRG